jgi:hypothetical protein
MMNQTKQDLELLAGLLLTMEYESLEFIPNFQIRMDTAKNNSINIISSKCSCIKCTYAINYITNLNFNEYE